MWHTKTSCKSFQTVSENMNHDLTKTETLSLQHRYLRCYIWEKAAITYGYNQTLNPELASFPNSKRPTGGGIVFHAPQDMVFSLCFHHTDPWFSRSLKDLSWLTHYLKGIFFKSGIIPSSSSEEKESDLTFCSSYPNPFELHYQGSKLLGISARKFRKASLIQCIIHLGNGQKAFSSIPAYKGHISQGVAFPIKVKAFQDLLLQNLKILEKSIEAPW